MPARDAGRIYTLLLAALLAACAVLPARAATGPNPDLMAYRGGLLIKNGQQTSCELGVIDGNAGFVAASCVTGASGAVDTSAQYEVYVDHTEQGLPASSPLQPSSITVHPGYNPKTFANNIALLQFSLVPVKQWRIRVALNRDDWTNVTFLRRHMEDIDGQVWDPAISGGSPLADSSCAGNYGLYGPNRNDFKCTASTAPKMGGSKCGVPYGTIYGISGNYMAVAGLYSHSVVDGSDLCSSKNAVHYYTLLTNYVPFAQALLGRSIMTYIAPGSSYVQSTNTAYAMAAGSFVTPQGMKAITGDAFSKSASDWQTASGTGTGSQPPGPIFDGGSSSNPQSDGSDNNSNTNGNGGSSNNNTNGNGNNSNGSNGNGNGSSNSNNNGGGNNNNGGGNGQGGTAQTSGMHSSVATAPGSGSMGQGVGGQINSSAIPDGSQDDDAVSGEIQRPGGTGLLPAGDGSGTGHYKGGGGGMKKGAAAALAVCLTLLVLGLLVGGYYVLRWRRERKARQWSPDAVQQILESHIVENEAGAAPEPKFELPSYRHHRATMLVASGPQSAD
ncbi:hypothetical protein H4R18_003086 [Coemansia javaensis]|uniref:Peptidase S1 domain-containing protein n=1 Tax=Coemansia javaensis TaxID=2761396 RepID=A0A9W8HD21_9FUNG|nr:hypothetical protein H4R18_003086 [Coemansia javaensis]